jgi:hypothetical protein
MSPSPTGPGSSTPGNAVEAPEGGSKAGAVPAARSPRFSLLLPGNREKDLSPASERSRNQPRLKDLREVARVEGKDETGRLFSLLSHIAGRERNGPAREPDHQELPDSHGSG